MSAPVPGEPTFDWSGWSSIDLLDRYDAMHHVRPITVVFEMISVRQELRARGLLEIADRDRGHRC